MAIAIAVSYLDAILASSSRVTISTPVTERARKAWALRARVRTMASNHDPAGTARHDLARPGRDAGI